MGPDAAHIRVAGVSPSKRSSSSAQQISPNVRQPLVGFAAGSGAAAPSANLCTSVIWPLTANIGSLRRPLTDDPAPREPFSELATILPNSAGKHAAAGEIYRLACDIGNRQFRLK
jgi:hypothetical protein